MRSGVFILICLLFETLVSQENKVEGSLFDARTNLPVNGASIEIEDSFHKTQSLADGSIASIEDYRFITGQIRGLTWCEEEIRTSMKGIEDE